MRKIIFALAFLPLVLFTACSSSEDDNIDAFTLSYPFLCPIGLGWVL